jgi:hypothetical protein
MSARIHQPNPFEFGIEFAPDRLVDRQEEVELVVRTAINRGRPKMPECACRKARSNI